MKKILVILIASFMTISILGGCASKQNTDNSKKPESNTSSDETDDNMSSFTTTDINGEKITQDIFKDYDVTMVNVWATTCTGCIMEMPAIAKVQNQLPENVNLITICNDLDEEKDVAIQILNDAHASFLTVAPSKTLDVRNFSTFIGTPTTYMVDKNGKILDVLVGPPTFDMDNPNAFIYDEDETIAGYLELIENALQAIGGK